MLESSGITFSLLLCLQRAPGLLFAGDFCGSGFLLTWSLVLTVLKFEQTQHCSSYVTLIYIFDMHSIFQAFVILHL